MIEVKELTKRFYDVVALDRISFEVGRDEVVGFLGPNGAGKSTTLKILTCFMPATSGTASVAGMDVFSKSLAVRRSIGYLPEQVPLYTDMRVHEYLNYRGRLKGLPGRDLKNRIGEVLDICGLEDMAGRIVGQLSKGYRQRVGLADVLIHNPPILLLDEPTGGLDPSQRREVRELVERLGEAHTVLLSSHILAEVESMCSRVIIIKKGRIIADGRPDELVTKLKGGRRIMIEAGCPLDEVLAAFNSFGQPPEIMESGEREGGRSFLAVPPADARDRAGLLRHLVESGVPVDEFRLESYSLEEIYMRLTLEQEILEGGDEGGEVAA
jgi:ABC-2 type transport system ATP-binding protein